MNKILEVAKNAKKIMASQNVVCPKCGEKQFSPFDKLYTSAYEECYMCSPDNAETELKSTNIFELIGN